MALSLRVASAQPHEAALAHGRTRFNHSSNDRRLPLPPSLSLSPCFTRPSSARGRAWRNGPVDACNAAEDAGLPRGGRRRGHRPSRRSPARRPRRQLQRARPKQVGLRLCRCGPAAVLRFGRSRSALMEAPQASTRTNAWPRAAAGCPRAPAQRHPGASSRAAGLPLLLPHLDRCLRPFLRPAARPSTPRS